MNGHVLILCPGAGVVTSTVAASIASPPGGHFRPTCTFWGLNKSWVSPANQVVMPIVRRPQEEHCSEGRRPWSQSA